MAKKVTLADIAAKVGVSNVAVYKALSGKPGVSDDLRVKIKMLAEEMGYKNTASEKEKTADRTGNIGVIAPEQYCIFSTSFYGQLYEKVVKALYRSNYYGILELLTAEDEKKGRMPKVLKEGKVDGLILLGQMREEYIDMMVKQTRLPVYFLDTYQPQMNLDTVISDGYHGTYMLTRYLIAQGHRRIGFVGSVEATSSIADRYWGYRRALRESGIVYQDSWEIPDRDAKGTTYENIIQDAGDLEAFVCNCDYAADVVMQNLKELGYGIPEDISVVGFDDFLPIGMEGNRVTTYEVDMEKMADVCVKSLIKKIDGKKYFEGIQIVPGKIIDRGTVAARKHTGNGK